jgi:hypothetical protein
VILSVYEPWQGYDLPTFEISEKRRMRGMRLNRVGSSMRLLWTGTSVHLWTGSVPADIHKYLETVS